MPLLIIKIKISSIVIGLKRLLSPTNSLTKLLSDNNIQSCGLNQPITFHETIYASFVDILMQISLSFITWLFFFSRDCNFYD